MYKDNQGGGTAGATSLQEREVIYNGRSPSTRYQKNVLALRTAHKKLVEERKHQVNYETSSQFRNSIISNNGYIPPTMPSVMKNKNEGSVLSNK